MKRYFPFVQDVHMYIGLFISPFIIIFGISALVFNHPGMVSKAVPVKTVMERKLKLDAIPYDSTDLGTGKAISALVGITGEVDHVFKNEDALSIGIMRPGLETTIHVDRHTDSVFIKQEQHGALQATAYLHKMPGPHLAMFRKNALFMKVWSMLSDATVYLMLLLTVSGIFLWYFLKAERKLGIYAICFGTIVFIGLFILIL